MATSKTLAVAHDVFADFAIVGTCRGGSFDDVVGRPDASDAPR